MKLHLARQAQRQAEKMEAWWASNRPAAPDLFARELRDTLEHIRPTPGAGIGWPTARRPALRRILMPRTENHIYFRVDVRTETVYVICIWGAPRGTTPTL